MQFIASFSPPTRTKTPNSRLPLGRLVVIFRNGTREVYSQATVLQDSEESISIEYVGQYLHLQGVESWTIETV
jgi:hypothetical protein